MNATCNLQSVGSQCESYIACPSMFVSKELGWALLKRDGLSCVMRTNSKTFLTNSISIHTKSLLSFHCNSRQFDVNSTFYSIRSTTLSTPFEYNTVQEILTNKQVSLSVTLKTAEISVMLP